MFLVALVLFSKNLFEPMCLSLSEPLIYERGIVTYDELLATALTPERSHFLETRRFLWALPALHIKSLLHNNSYVCTKTSPI